LGTCPTSRHGSLLSVFVWFPPPIFWNRCDQQYCCNQVITISVHYQLSCQHNVMSFIKFGWFMLQCLTNYWDYTASNDTWQDDCKWWIWWDEGLRRTVAKIWTKYLLHESHTCYWGAIWLLTNIIFIFAQHRWAQNFTVQSDIYRSLLML
jgi:hypothetical protein